MKVVVNDTGLPVSRMEYLPYGETWFEEGNTNNAPKYNSQELDKETGYYFYNARHYDPQVSRFVTPDTIIPRENDTQSWNRYSYCSGNPIRYKDPTGHQEVNEEALEAATTDPVVLQRTLANPELLLQGPNQPDTPAGSQTNTSTDTATASTPSNPNAATNNNLQNTNTATATGNNQNSNPSASGNAVDSTVQNNTGNQSPNITYLENGARLGFAPGTAYTNQNNFWEERVKPNGETYNHQGNDYSVAANTPVYAVSSGTVTGAGYSNSMGNYVIIDHGVDENGNRVTSTVMHNTSNNVAVGDVVQEGQQIGSSGNTGQVSGPTGQHVHYQIQAGNEYQNPDTFDWRNVNNNANEDNH